MTPDDGQYTVMLILWTIILAVVLFILLPMTVLRARRLVAAARSIDRNMAVSLQAAAAAVANTSPTRAALAQTIECAGAVLAVAGRVDAHTAAIEGVLARRAEALTS